jgi:hypothetical protein
MVHRYKRKIKQLKKQIKSKSIQSYQHYYYENRARILLMNENNFTCDADDEVISWILHFLHDVTR